MRVVLCDDHTMFTEALASQLESRGHVVVAALSSTDGLVPAVLDNRPDAVLLDLSFPCGSGLDAAAEVRGACADVRIVLCTGESSSTLDTPHLPVRTALRAGILDALVEKTADYPAIEAALRGDTDWTSTAPAAAPKPFSRLTPREVDVLAVLAEGLSTREAAARLGVAPSTVHAHVQSVMLRLDVRSRFEAVHEYVVATGRA